MKEAEKQRLIAVKEAEEARLAAEREKKEASASQNVSLTPSGKEEPALSASSEPAVLDESTGWKTMVQAKLYEFWVKPRGTQSGMNASLAI